MAIFCGFILPGVTVVRGSRVGLRIPTATFVWRSAVSKRRFDDGMDGFVLRDRKATDCHTTAL